MLSPSPRPVWRVWTSVFVLAMVLTPLLGTLLIAEELRSISGLVTVNQLVVFPTALLASILLYVQYRLSGSDVTGWVTLCLTQFSVQGVALAGITAAQHDALFMRAGWVPIIEVPAGLLMLAFLRLSGRVRLAVDPLGTGLALGLIIAGTTMAATSWGGSLALTSPPVVAAQVALVVVGVGIVQTTYRLSEIPRWCAVRLSLGALALVINRVASVQDVGGTAGTVQGTIAVASGITGAVLMVIAAAGGLRYVIQEQGSSLVALSDQVAAMEADKRDSRERMHEITNSIASIAVASSLIHQDGEVPPDTRRKLERMLESEAGRLTRLLTGRVADVSSRPVDPPAPEVDGVDGVDGVSQIPMQVVDLDEVIGPLVTAQEALQRQVDWQPTGHRGVGDPDAVAEVVNILLDNSARHAPGARTSIEVAQYGDMVEVAVCDDGPGIPAEVRRHLFEWGGRGPDSHGQGIGLHLAHRLMSSTGSSLRLERNEAGHAFVIGLPAAEETPE